MGKNISEIIKYADDGYVYCSYDAGMSYGLNYLNDLRRCNPDGSGVITLFKGSSLPDFDEADYMGYHNVEVVGNYVYFTAYVHGYSNGDSWRGHTMYEAAYRVRKDGSGLELISENNYG